MYAEKSDLLTGAAWDRTMDWIINQNNRGLTIRDIVLDSKSWGNYQDSSFSATGTGSFAKTGAFGDYTKVNNIYDLAGNVKEWCSATFAYASVACVNRGGDNSTSGSYSPAFQHESYDTANSVDQNTRLPCCTLFVNLCTAWNKLKHEIC